MSTFTIGDFLYRRTHFDTLVYAKVNAREWSFFNVEKGENVAGKTVIMYQRVGLVYRTEKELLSDLDRYGNEFFGTQTESVGLTTYEKEVLFDLLTETVYHKHLIAVSPLEKADKKYVFSKERDALFSVYQKLGGHLSLNHIIGVDA